jgi:type IV secretory pathway ATPase VirB11/archaellum biosynthesis ATPase
MKTSNSKVVRLNPKEQLIVELFRESDIDLLRELKRLYSSQDSSTGISLPAIKKLIRILDTPQFLGLEELVDQGFISKSHANSIIEAIERNKHILIVGKIGVGKTTLLRAILDQQFKIYQNRKTLLLDEYMELKFEDEAHSNLVTLNKTGSFGINEMNFLQNTIDQSLLCIGEINNETGGLALSSGLMTKSKVFATLYGGDWKESLLSFVNGNAKGVYNDILSQHSFVIVKVESSSFKRHVTDVWEDQITLSS